MKSNIKYFCHRCRNSFPAATEPTFTSDSTILINEEIILKLPNKKDINKTFFGKKLTCNHFVSLSTPGFSDPSSESLSDIDTHEIRKLIDKAMLKKTSKEIEETILFHVEQYQTLLKIAQKQRLQAKYAIQYLDQLKEKYATLLLDSEEKRKFEVKFALFVGESKPSTTKTVERMKKEVKGESDKQREALDAVKALLGKKGFKTDLLKKLAKKEE